MEDPDPGPHQPLLWLIGTINAGSVYLLPESLLLILLLVLAAVISGAEIAYMALTPENIQAFQNTGSRSETNVIRLLEKPRRLTATIIIGKVLFYVWFAVMMFRFLTLNYAFNFWANAGIIAGLLLFFGEILPKVVAGQNPVNYSKFTSRLILLLRWLFYPLSSVFVVSTRFIDQKFNLTREISIEKLSEAFELKASVEDTPEDERKILKGIVKFSDIEVSEVMTARIDVTTVSDDASFADVIQTIIESGYSRIPVYSDSFDNVTGILYVKDVLPFLSGDSDFNWKELQRPPFFVSENMLISNLLQEFRERKNHMAIVVDKYGGTSGLVTLEDILEEIVGDINDEFDSDAETDTFTKVDENNYLFEGKTLLNDFFKALDIEDEVFDSVRGEADTIAGLMLELAGKIPLKGESIRHGNYTFKADQVDKRRIRKILVTIDPGSE